MTIKILLTITRPNTSLAAPGALAHRLQRPNRLLNPKWPTWSGKRLKIDVSVCTLTQLPSPTKALFAKRLVSALLYINTVWDIWFCPSSSQLFPVANVVKSPPQIIKWHFPNIYIYTKRGGGWGDPSLHRTTLWTDTACTIIIFPRDNIGLWLSLARIVCRWACILYIMVI